MRPALKLNDIEQEHLQEVYNSAGVPRDQLSYTEQFFPICEGFQNRTFKNADAQQVYGALLKYSRVGSHKSLEAAAPELTPDQAKQLKATLKKHGQAGRLMPYGDEFAGALADFNKVASLNLSLR